MSDPVVRGPTHEPLVSREMFEEAARRSVSRDNAVKAARARENYAPRTYLLRLPPLRGVLPSDARAGAPRVAYYTSGISRRQVTLTSPEHPRMVYVREYARWHECSTDFLQTHFDPIGTRSVCESS